MNTCKDLVDEQDPDYATPGPSNSIQQQKLYEKTARTNTSRKINAIIDKEFTREIDAKENEILLIQNRLNQALKTLHLLRYVIITDFYNRKQCISQPQPGTNEHKQTRIHPAIKQVIGQPQSNLTNLSCENNNSNEEFNSPTTEPCYSTVNKITDNELLTIEQLNNKSLINDSNSKKRILDDVCENNSIEPLKKIPRHIPPKYSGPEPKIPSRGDRHKIIKRIIVGNMSNWIPPGWREDNASHKWIIYVRGKKENAQINDFVAKIRFFLHPSYRPNDVVEVTSSPFYLSRRGWGEFPVRVQLHFKNSSNKPMDIIHNLKLDRTYTGLWTLGSETVVDIWIKTQAILEQSHSDNENFIVKKELSENNELNEQENNVTIEEHTTINESKKIIDYRHIFMDHDYINFYEDKSDIEIKNENNQSNKLKINGNGNELIPLQIIIPPRFPSLNVQKNCSTIPSNSSNKQIVVLKKSGSLNKNDSDRGTSLLKLNINPSNSLLIEPNNDIPALQIAPHPIKINEINQTKLKITVGKDKMKLTTKRDYYENILKSIDNVQILHTESLIRFIIKRLPLIDENASDPEYKKIHPYVCSSEKEFINYNVGKQRALEWYRAKAIHSYLKKKSISNEQLWTIKEIMMWCRVHGYSPPINLSIPTSTKLINNKTINNSTEIFLINTNTAPEPLIKWQKQIALISNKSLQADELIDIVNIDEDDIKNEKYLNQFDDRNENNKNDLMILQLPNYILPLHTFVCNTARLIGIKIVPEELVPGVSHCAAGRLIVKSLECLLEDLLRSSLARAWERNNKNMTCPDVITLEDVRGALLNRDEFDIFTNSGLMDINCHNEPTNDDD